MALSREPENSANENKNEKTSAFQAASIPNQNSGEAMMYSLRQGAVGGTYGLVGSSLFSLFAYRYCKRVFLRLFCLFLCT